MIEDSRPKSPTPRHSLPGRVAPLLYEAYGKAQNWDGPSGEVLPDWSGLDKELHKAWLHLAKMAIAALSAGVRLNVTGEQLYLRFQNSLGVDHNTGQFTRVPTLETYSKLPTELQSAWDSTAEAFNKVVRA